MKKVNDDKAKLNEANKAVQRYNDGLMSWEQLFLALQSIKENNN